MLAPPIKKGAIRKPKSVKYETSVPKIVFDSYVVFFQRVISPVDGPRCQLYPTCSQYGRQAIQKHGAFLGFILSAERLMRDNGGVPQYHSLVRRGNRLYYYDPLTDNDFWWEFYE
ncbi:MAG: membrane protein insertion efficiency factor YidD [Candidatus Schekmanbacteria bacterium]|nr:membrane protein insertion efficiency factor YidD [Candidatus Schekmanbacteria bacterium]